MLSPRLVRSEPFRIFFPLACLVGAAGVAHWIAFASGAMGTYLGVFHAITQTQAFLTAFAAGFLMTAIPKRTGSLPAGWTTLGAMALLVPATSVAAFFGAIAASQLAYAASLAVLAAFAVRRFLARGAARRPPASFVLVPMGLVTGIVGALLFARGAEGRAAWYTLGLGRALVQQGVFLCLTLGVGGFFLPLTLRGEAAADLRPDRASARAIAFYVAAGVAVIAALVLDARALGAGSRIGPLLCAVATVAVLVASGACRPPTRPGTNRRLLWAAPWAIPIGLLLAAAFPAHRVAAMHLAYVGGFGLLAFCVATHVTLGHSGEDRLQNGRPWPVAVFGALFATAAVLRALATAWVELYLSWLLLAAAVWLAAAVVWALFLLPKLWRVPVKGEGAA